MYIPKENRLYRERQMLEQIIQVMGEQQQMSKESVEIINRKCHDIKHQLKALMEIEDKEQRRKYTEEIVFEDGLPVTDKKDRAYHGFGIRSIRHIAEKYGGEMVLKKEAERFVPDILIPVPGEEGQQRSREDDSGRDRGGLGRSGAAVD